MTTWFMDDPYHSEVKLLTHESTTKTLEQQQLGGSFSFNDSEHF